MKEKENMQGSFFDNVKSNKLKVVTSISIILLTVVLVILILLLNRKIPEYTITFDTKGGSIIEEIRVKENETITRPKDPIRENYQFIGWYYNDELYDFSKPVTSNMTLEAMWQQMEIGSVTGVELNITELTLYVGNTLQLTATVLPEDATDKTVTWESSAPDIVSVDSEGNIQALKEGTAIITVTTNNGGYTASATITVTKTVSNNAGTNSGTNNNQTTNNNPTVTPTPTPTPTATATPTPTPTATPAVVKVTGVSLNKTSLSLTEGDTSKLIATVNPSNATNKNVTWSSSNLSVVSVDTNGNIQALKAGSATITVTTKDGSYTATCQVTVNEQPASYTVTFTKETLAVTGANFGYTVAVTKNNKVFNDYNFIRYTADTLVKPGGRLSSIEYNENITSVKIRLRDGSDVTATVIYKYQ